jgi:hypothetical protein
LMLGKVDCGDGALVLDLVDSPLDMSFGAGHDRSEIKRSKGKMAGREAQRGRCTRAVLGRFISASFVLTAAILLSPHSDATKSTL